VSDGFLHRLSTVFLLYTMTICLYWSIFNLGFKVTAHRTTTPYINMLLHQITLYWHWVNKSCSNSDMGNINYGGTKRAATCVNVLWPLAWPGQGWNDRPTSHEANNLPLSYRDGNINRVSRVRNMVPFKKELFILKINIIFCQYKVQRV